MSIDSVTLSDGEGQRERSPSRSGRRRPPGAALAVVPRSIILRADVGLWLPVLLGGPGASTLLLCSPDLTNRGSVADERTPGRQAPAPAVHAPWLRGLPLQPECASQSGAQSLSGGLGNGVSISATSSIGKHRRESRPGPPPTQRKRPASRGRRRASARRGLITPRSLTSSTAREGQENCPNEH